MKTILRTTSHIVVCKNLELGNLNFFFVRDNVTEWKGSCKAMPFLLRSTLIKGKQIKENWRIKQAKGKISYVGPTWRRNKSRTIRWRIDAKTVIKSVS